MTELIIEPDCYNMLCGCRVTIVHISSQFLMGI